MKCRRYRQLVHVLGYPRSGSCGVGARMHGQEPQLRRPAAEYRIISPKHRKHLQSSPVSLNRRQRALIQTQTWPPAAPSQAERFRTSQSAPPSEWAAEECLNRPMPARSPFEDCMPLPRTCRQLPQPQRHLPPHTQPHMTRSSSLWTLKTSSTTSLWPLKLRNGSTYTTRPPTTW